MWTGQQRVRASVGVGGEVERGLLVDGNGSVGQESRVMRLCWDGDGRETVRETVRCRGDLAQST